MKKSVLATLLSLTLISNVEASHILGGQIWYEYISTSFTDATFKVHLDLYRDATGITLGATQVITVISTSSGSVISNTNKTLQRITPEYPINSHNCGGAYSVLVNSYEGIVTIQNYYSTTFSWSQCCRAAGITGLSGSAGEGFYIEAKVNLENPNTRRFENSVFPPQIGILRLSPGVINQVAIPHTELDGDSIYAVFKPAKTTINTNVSYANGYAFNQPIRSDSLYPFHVESDFTGFSGKPLYNESSVVSLRIDNYVYDTVLNTPFRIGYITLDIPVTVQTSPITNQPITISAPSNSAFQANLTLSHPIYSNSLATDNSEFELLKNGQPIINALQEINYNCSPLGLIDTVSIKLDTLLISGNYILHHKVGSDSTFLIGECGTTTSDTSHILSIPFVPSIINGDTNVYSTGTYKLSNFNNIDSVLWVIHNGEFTANSDTLVITTPSDSVQVNFSGQIAKLSAIRLGNLDSDTLSLNISAFGVGISELDILNSSPNPTTGVVKVNSIVVGTFELLSADGRLIDSGETKKDYDLSQQPNGVYNLRIRTADGTRVLKIIKN